MNFYLSHIKFQSSHKNETWNTKKKGSVEPLGEIIDHIKMYHLFTYLSLSGILMRPVAEATIISKKNVMPLIAK